MPAFVASSAAPKPGSSGASRNTSSMSCGRARARCWPRVGCRDARVGLKSDIASKLLTQADAGRMFGRPARHDWRRESMGKEATRLSHHDAWSDDGSTEAFHE